MRSIQPLFKKKLLILTVSSLLTGLTSTNAAAANDWENPEVIQVNRMQPRVTSY